MPPKKTKEVEEEKNKPIIIAGSEIERYAWILVLKFQEFKDVRLHFRPKYYPQAEHLANLFSSLGIQLISKNKVMTVNDKDPKDKFEVIELVLQKIPAIGEKIPAKI